MKTSAIRADSFGVISTLGIALAVWLLQANGLLQKSDDVLCDQVNAYSADSLERSNVLLVYAPQEVFSSDGQQLATLVQEISRFRPAKIGIADPLSPSQVQHLGSLPDAVNIVLGSKRAGLVKLRSLLARQPSMQVGFSDLYLDDEAVLRKHVAINRDVSPATWSFEAVMAKAIQPSVDQLPSGVMRIRFRSGMNGLPNVTASDFADGRLISEMVAGRLVLIGAATPEELGFTTPTTFGSQRMQTLEVRGNVIECLLSQSHITLLGMFSGLLALIWVTLVAVQAFRNANGKWVPRTFGLCLLAVAGLSWACIAMFSIQLPITAMLLCIVTAFVRVQHQRYFELKQVLNSWEANRHTADRISFDDLNENLWAALATSVSQIFDPKRMLLMELSPGDTHLQVVYHHECSDRDYGDKRRDVRRNPYKTAIEQRYPLRVDAFPLLKKSELDDCTEFVIPLVMVSEVVGVLVLEMSPAVIAKWEHLEDSLSRYADEMAIYLAKARADNKQGSLAKRVSNRMRYLPEKPIAAELYRDDHEHRRVKEMLAGALNSAQSSIAISDIFGQLVRTNQQMDALLKQRDVSAQTTSCVEILAAITGFDAVRCRDIFRRCIVDGYTEQLVLAPQGGSGASSVMFVKALADDSDNGCEARFVSIEIVSGDIFQLMDQWHMDYRRTVTAQANAGLDRLQHIAGAIDSSSASSSDADSLSDLASEMLQTVDDVQQVVQTSLTQSAKTSYRLDSLAVLNTALEKQRDNLDSCSVTVITDLPEKTQKCLANPYLLEKVFTTIIRILIRDCDDQTQMLIGADQSSGRLKYTFGTRLTTAIEEANHEGSSVLQDGASDGLLSEAQTMRLREAQQWLHEWGADLTTECDSGFRVSFTITLDADVDQASQPTSDTVSPESTGRSSNGGSQS